MRLIIFIFVLGSLANACSRLNYVPPPEETTLSASGTAVISENRDGDILGEPPAPIVLEEIVSHSTRDGSITDVSVVTLEETILPPDEEPPPVEPPVENEAQCFTINFDEDAAEAAIDPGRAINDQYALWGVSISAQSHNASDLNVGITFPSQDPTGEDEDLLTPGPGLGNDKAQFNLLIIAEDDVDSDGDTLVDDPDDEASGGRISFSFANPVFPLSILLVDIEEEKTAIEVKASDTEEVKTLPIAKAGDNSVQKITLDQTTPISQVDVVLSGSGAVDDFIFCDKQPEE